jgi:hypothetical protein
MPYSNLETGPYRSCFRIESKDDDTDDLFGGLDDPKPVSRQSKTDFMSDLFGSKNDENSLNKGKEFVLDDKYKKLAEKSSKPEPVSEENKYVPYLKWF